MRERAVRCEVASARRQTVHKILLPSNRLIRLGNSYRHPAQAAAAARLPLAGRRVPLRSFWRRQPLKPGSIAGHTVESAAAAAGVIEHLPLDGAGVAAGVASRAGARLISMKPAMADLSDAASRGGHRLAETARQGREALPALADARSHAQAAAAPIASAAGAAYHIAGDATGGATARTQRLGKRIRLPLPGLSILGPLIAGAALMWFADPAQGRRRRALLRDRLVHAGHVLSRLPDRVERRGRVVRGFTRGVTHGVTNFVDHSSRHGGDDAETLVARVRSEVLRDGRVKAGEINIDAYAGCVTLRGQLERPSDIRGLVDATKRVEGVTEVRSYLHLPDEPPPNKADVYEHATQHLPAM